MKHVAEGKPRRSARDGKPDAGALLVRDVMSRDVVTVSPDMTLRELIDILRSEQVTGAPVVAGSRVLGVVSVSDVLDFEVTRTGVSVQSEESGEELAGEPETESVPAEDEAGGAAFEEWWADAGAETTARYDALAGPEWDVLNEHTVEEVMSVGVRAVRPDLSLADASAFLLREEIHRALVMDGSTLLGIVTTTDITRALAGRAGQRSDLHHPG